MRSFARLLADQNSEDMAAIVSLAEDKKNQIQEEVKKWEEIIETNERISLELQINNPTVLWPFSLIEAEPWQKDLHCQLMEVEIVIKKAKQDIIELESDLAHLESLLLKVSALKEVLAGNEVSPEGVREQLNKAWEPVEKALAK